MPAKSLRISLLVILVLLTSAYTDSSGVAAAEETINFAALAVDGPYEIRAYSSFPEATEFGDATIYYPLATEAAIGGVAIAPGFTESQRHINWWGPRLASHGYAVLVLNTNEVRESPSLRGDALIAAVRLLKAENSRSASPLNGRIDVNKMAIMGHSMGGAGTLIAANNHSDEIQAAIPFTPWQPDGVFDQIAVPTLVIAGSNDSIAAVDAHAWPHYQSIPSSTPSVYMEIEGGNHFLANSNGPDLGTVSRYGIAWLKLYLDGDERYREFIFGDSQKIDAAKFSRYITNP